MRGIFDKLLCLLHLGVFHVLGVGLVGDVAQSIYVHPTLAHRKDSKG